jgi:hypothetical protein
MACSFCGKRLNSGMIKKRNSATRKLYKSCPHCSDADGKEHVYHPYPANFGKGLNKTPMITSSQKNSFAIYYDGCLVNYALIGRNLNIAADFRQVFFS